MSNKDIFLAGYIADEFTEDQIKLALDLLEIRQKRKARKAQRK